MTYQIVDIIYVDRILLSEDEDNSIAFTVICHNYNIYNFSPLVTDPPIKTTVVHCFLCSLSKYMCNRWLFPIIGRVLRSMDGVIGNANLSCA